jgi:hypothetical protein
MSTKKGYLAALDNVPPLIFRFQFNPDILNIKKGYQYQPANSFGQWGFDQTSGAAAGLLSGAKGFYKDIKEWGSLLSNVKPLEAKEGDPQEIALEFKLDATDSAASLNPLITDHPNTIESDLAILQSFMYPSWDIFDLFKVFTTWPPPCPAKPPECSFVYGGVSINCVMTNLSIKITQFGDGQSNPEGKPVRADVEITLKEQTFAISPISQMVKRGIFVFKGYSRNAGFFSEGGLADDVNKILNPFA